MTTEQKLLEFIGKDELGENSTSPKEVIGGLLIASATRANGDKCIVGVKYSDAAKKYVVVSDPECSKGMIASIDELLTYEKRVAKPEAEAGEGEEAEESELHPDQEKVAKNSIIKPSVEKIAAGEVAKKK